MDMNDIKKGGGKDMHDSLSFNQITLITDGLSNQGISPIEAARRAYKKNIILNVVGITDNGDFNSKGKQEIEQIAKAGGGLSQIVPVEKIAKTVQMVTRTAINKTIQQVVQFQLKELLCKDDISELQPLERLKVAEMMDNISEHSKLKVLLLVDQSSSMVSKMEKVKEAILDFQLSLKSRTGESSISIVTFPDETDFIKIRIPWTYEINQIESLLYKIKPKGNTPTGPAILAGLSYFGKIDNKVKQGVLDEYII